ncbi:MAG: tryptophan synthase subunit alpha [Halobacteriaceae archaeon]
MSDGGAAGEPGPAPAGVGTSAIPSAFADGPAFVPYLAVGDPDYEQSLRYVEALVEGGADIVELGLPFSEAIADGPTIQAATARALDAGMTPDRFFEFVTDLDVDVPLVCMTYYNLVAQYGDAEGPRPFVERAAEVGIDGFVIPDLPAEEAGALRRVCDEFGRDLVFVVAPTTRGERLDRLLDLTSGFVYVQARLGTTGARSDVSGQTAETLSRLSDCDLPKAVGFGISSGDQAADVVAAGADGVIVGSALVEIVAEGHETDADPAAVAADLRDLASELAAGARRGAERQEADQVRPEGS